MLKLYDTLSSTIKSLNSGKTIRIYLCGITVYDEAHIGHARTIIIFDSLRKFLEENNFNVEFIQNFTDVDDKIIDRAKKERTTASKLSERYIHRYFEDFAMLNVKRATKYPKATEHIYDMIEFIQDLIKKDFAYVSENGVYFKVNKFKEYGKLSKKKVEELLSGARIDIDKTKKTPLDFALWKFSNEEPYWDSPWGHGRPGWHIECSVMSTRYLGVNFEIHGGGRDLIFPHHENEIAQSEACTGSQFAKIWMHVGMVTIQGEKMSKSVGNIITVAEALSKWGPNVTRLFCLATHYSKPIDYSDDLLRENVTKWRQIETCYFEVVNAVDFETDKEADMMLDDCKTDFDNALENDFNTHLALMSFFKLVKEINRLASKNHVNKKAATKALPVLKYMMNVLGLVVHTPSPEMREKIMDLIKQRESLRRQKKFDDADKVRNELHKMNVELVDHKGWTNWILKEKINAEST